MVPGAASRCGPCEQAYRRLCPETRCKGHGDRAGRCRETGVYARAGPLANLCERCARIKQERGEDETLCAGPCRKWLLPGAFDSDGRSGAGRQSSVCRTCLGTDAHRAARGCADADSASRSLGGEDRDVLRRHRADDLTRAMDGMKLKDSPRWEAVIHEGLAEPDLKPGRARVADGASRKLKREQAKPECFFCGRLPDGHDRRCSLGEMLDGSPPVLINCCWRCSRSKAGLDAITFVKRSRHIDAFQVDGTELHHHDAWSEKNNGRSYKKLLQDAKEKGLEAELTENEFNEIIAEPCEYCGFDKGRMGLDRIDNMKGHVRGNFVPCCTPCNMMKGNVSPEKFYARCQKVAERVDLDILPAVRIRLICNERREA